MVGMGRIYGWKTNMITALRNSIESSEAFPAMQAIKEAGGNPLVVGGFIRDWVLGIPSKDIDIEVFGLSVEELITVLEQFGEVEKVGMRFGVIKVHGIDADFSLPRWESKEGKGHKGFVITPDSAMSIKEACRRRDITINAISYSYFEDKIHDPYGGLEDIEREIIRHTSEQFAEDPVRVKRIMQICSRIPFEVFHATIFLCETLKPEFSTIDKDVLWVEWEKWATKGIVPSNGLRFLKDCGWLEFYPEIYNLVGLEQEPAHHPEGDVFEHICHTVDSLTNDICWGILPKDEKIIYMFSALLHDVGKITTTEIRDGKIISHRHDKEGEQFVISFCNRIGMPQKYIDIIVPLVKEHMVHVHNRTPNRRMVRRLANRLHPATINQLMVVMEADHSGRPPLKGGLPKEAKMIATIAKDLVIDNNKPQPIIMGRHLITEFSLTPNPEFGILIEKAFQAQLDGAFDCVEDGVEWIRNYLKERNIQ